MKLADINIKRAKPGQKTIKMPDGGGLYLQIEPSGGKLWRYRFRFEGREKILSIGKCPDVPLAEARRRHQQAREQLANGIDPAAAKQAVKRAKKGQAENSFEKVAYEWYEVWKPDKSDSHVEKTWARLKNDVFPYIGGTPVNELKALDVLEVCRRVEKRGYKETAHRIKMSIGLIMRYAVITGRCEHDPTAALKGALKPVLKQSYPSLIEPDQIGELLRAIDTYKGTAIVRAALALAPLLFVRPGELRAAKWADIDIENAEWTFVYLKQRSFAPQKKLIVPLSTQALAIFKDLEPMTGDGEFVFPGHIPGRQISDATINKALRTLGYDTRTELTGHGFRAMARTVIAERLHLDPRWIERQLSHVTSERLGESYDRAQYLEDRRRMMQLWADYLDELRAKADQKASGSKSRKKRG
jgi:integrase